MALVSFCVLLFSTDASAKIHPDAVLTSIGGKGKTALVAAAISAVGAAIGLGIYFAIRQSHVMRGCVVTGPNGLELQKAGGDQTFLLLGAIKGVTPGDRIKVHGSRKKQVAGVTDRPSFVIDKVDKDYGTCPVSSQHR
jgi:hypothetical protein